jgi:hypothetical protein
LPPAAIHWRPDIFLSSVFDVFLPIQHLWKVIFEDNLAAVLNFIYVHFSDVPMLSSISGR